MERESPMPKHPDLFASFPSQAAGERYVYLYTNVAEESTGGRSKDAVLNGRRHRALLSPSAPVRADIEAKNELADLESFV